MFANRSKFSRRALLSAALASAGLGLVQPAGAQGPTGLGKGSAAFSVVSNVQAVELQIGEQRVIPSEGVRSYSEGVRGIVDVRLTKDASEFVVVALAPGTTTLLFLMLDGSERHFKFTVNGGRGAKASDPNTVEARDNIRLDFYFVQLSKSYGHQVGLGFPTQFAPELSATINLKTGALDSATAVISEQPLPHLDMAQTSGWAKVMRQAAVVTANGERASFSGGGEVNVPIQSALTSGLAKIEFGSVTEVEPRYDAVSGRIELRIHADISELESDRGTGIPGRMTSALDTVVNLELGQSLILAGLTAKTQRKSKAGIPGLSQIPILGVLFGTHGEVEEQSENIVIIVPSVVDAVSMQDRQRLKAALRHYEDYSGDLEEVEFMPQAKTSRPRVRADAGAGGKPPATVGEGVER